MPDQTYVESEITETINLQRLGLEDVSQTGSFVLGDLDRTAIGQLLSAIPMPILLASLPDAQIRFLNQNAGEILGQPSAPVGGSLFRLVTVDVRSLKSSLNSLYTTRRQQRLELWIKAGRKIKWVRLHLRSLRLWSDRIALILIEDLTHEKEVLGQKAAQLEKQNELLQKEIVHRRKIETQLKQAWVGCIRSLSKMSELKDPYTAGHQRRVTKLSVAIAEELGLAESEKNAVAIAAEVHDVGKLSVPVELLSKPGQLSEAEYSILKEHPRVGYEILKEAQVPKRIVQAVLHHHERIGGQGYPQGLRGEEIALEARIIAVADVVEAMSAHRPYRPSRGLKEAVKEISTQKGDLYDVRIVDACIRVLVKGFRFQ